MVNKEAKNAYRDNKNCVKKFIKYIFEEFCFYSMIAITIILLSYNYNVFISMINYLKEIFIWI